MRTPSWCTRLSRKREEQVQTFALSAAAGHMDGPFVTLFWAYDLCPVTSVPWLSRRRGPFPSLCCFLFVCLFCAFETGPHYVVQAGLELDIPLPQEHWDCRHALPYSALSTISPALWSQSHVLDNGMNGNGFRGLEKSLLGLSSCASVSAFRLAHLRWLTVFRRR